MLYIGTQITAAADLLAPISEEELLCRINTPNTDVHRLTEQLQTVRSVDKKQYDSVKKRLPYFVCGHFNPAIRRTENFAYIESFVVDIDHISEKGLNLETLKQQFQRDERVVLCFVSPSRDGLKLLFHLSERCYDAGIFSLFYKEFVLQFSHQYGLEQVVDMKTSDVTRACFICYDPNAYYNPLAESILIARYINVHDTATLFEQKRQFDVQAKNLSKETDALCSAEPDTDALNRIKEILSLKKAKSVSQSVFVPMQVNTIMEQLTEYLLSMEIHIDEVVDISYGKKVRSSMGQHKAETNIFYGKKGYSVVISPRNGTNAEFNEMVADLIKLFLNIL